MTDRTDIPAQGADELSSRFPWFDIPLLERCADGRQLPARLAILSRYRPAIVRPSERSPETAGERQEAAPLPADDTLSIIDEFMRSGEHRITADEHTPEEISGLEAGGLPSDDLLTEELAAIYLDRKSVV